MKWLLLDLTENSDLQQLLETDPGYQTPPHGMRRGISVRPAGCKLEALTQLEAHRSCVGAPGRGTALLSDLQQTLAPEQGICQTPSRKLHLLLSGIEGKIRRSIIKLRAAFVSRHCLAPELARSSVWVTPSILPWEGAPCSLGMPRTPKGAIRNFPLSKCRALCLL